MDVRSDVQHFVTSLHKFLTKNGEFRGSTELNPTEKGVIDGSVKVMLTPRGLKILNLTFASVEQGEQGLVNNRSAVTYSSYSRNHTLYIRSCYCCI